jgi:HlyD family secretion protein
MTMTRVEDLGELRSIRLNLMGAAVLAFLLVGGIGVWASTTELSGAVIASGTIVVDSSIKKVQHLTGGIVARLLVRDGDKVSDGEIVVRLDDTVLRANLAIVTKGIADLTARKSRLESERDGADEIHWPAALLGRMDNPEVNHAVDGERKLFEFRRSARAGQKTQLRERIAQLKEEIRGQTALQEAKREEIELIKKELEGVQFLWDRNLVQLTRLTALSREAARLKGELAQSISATAQSRGKITEIEQQILQIDQDLSSEVARDLREVESKLGESVEKMVAAQDQLKRVDIRAPQGGIVHQLSVHTVGGVVAPSDPIMMIVPEADQLAVEAKIAPQDIDQLHLGQDAGLRFSAFNQRTTPEISGTISRISADVTADQRNGQNFFTVRVLIPPDEIQRLGEVRLVPGMPVEIFARTYDRTVLSYFIKPLRDQLTKAFRER